MTPRTVRALVPLVLACLGLPARTAAQHRHSSTYMMRVDYNPRTNEAAGLCRVNGHPCWLLLDTGWTALSIYADHAPGLGVAVPAPKAKGYTFVQLDLDLQQSRPLEFQAPASLLPSSDEDRTSTGQPICGILGIPFLDVLPTEWNVPAHKVIFWLRGRPKDFRHVPRRMTLRGTLFDLDHLAVPVRVRGRRGLALLDTGSNEICLPDSLISEFPSAGADGTASGPGGTFRCTLRSVMGLKLGPLTLGGTVFGRLPGPPFGHIPVSYGFIGMGLISPLHLFVVGDKILFDPHERGAKFETN